MTLSLRLATPDRGPANATRIDEGDPLPPPDRVIETPRRRLDALYRAQAPRVLRFFARSSARHEAEDAMHDSFIRLIASDAVAEGRVENPEAYLQQVARNTLRNRARAAFHRSIVDFDLDEQGASDGTDPVAALEARDMLARMQAALDRLPARTRAIFMAHRLEGATYAEVAAAHGLSIKGVEWHMSKAIAHLHRVAGKK